MTFKYTSKYYIVQKYSICIENNNEETHLLILI